MKKQFSVLLLSVCSLLFYSQNSEFVNANNSEIIKFTANFGQITDEFHNSRKDVNYSGCGASTNYFLRYGGISYQLKRIDSWKYELTKTKKKINVPEKYTLLRMDINWLGINQNIRIVEEGELEGFENYYTSSNVKGNLYVKSYKGITYQNIYNNIDLHYYSKDGSLKYDFIVNKGGNYKAIQLEVLGAEKITIERNGSLTLHTDLGDIIEEAPVVFQNNEIIKSKWKLNGNKLSFEIGKYNPDLPLIIDPVTRLWGTFYGGSSNDESPSCTTDAAGNFYFCGRTDSQFAITTFGAHQFFFGGGFRDAFLVKFNSNGVRQWGTYYGDTGSEEGEGCITDKQGNVFLTGRSTSSGGTVIATPASYQSNYAGGNGDAFLVKFNSNGVRQWGTYFGGPGEDAGLGCATDSSGNIFICGETNSGSGMCNSLSYQQAFGGGLRDGFLAKFDNNGIYQWSTYYGDSGDDGSANCCVSPTGNLYMTGFSDAINSAVIATANGHQTIKGGETDAYLVKFDSNGNRLWGTFYGGGGTDGGAACRVTLPGYIYLSGTTDSSYTGISTVGSHQPLSGGSVDGFIVKFDSMGVRQWGTYYGGSGTDAPEGCSVDPNGNVFLSGFTDTPSGNGIASPSTYQGTLMGTADGFLAKFSPSGTRLWGTYYGDVGLNFGSACATDVLGNTYLIGKTNSTGQGFVSPACQQNFNAGSMDIFIAKFTDCGAGFTPSVASSASLICQGSTATLTASGANSYTWNTGANNASISVSPSVTTNYTVNFSNGSNCNLLLTISQAVTNCTGMEDLKRFDDIYLAPNPTSGKFSVQIKDFNSSCLLEIINVLGQTILTQQINSEKTTIDLQNYPAGIYYIRITSGTAQSKKLIKVD